MLKYTKVQIKEGHKFHAKKIGYFQFKGTGPSEGSFVFSDKLDGFPQSFFVVGANDFNVLPSQ